MAALTLAPSPASAQSSDNVLLVINESSPDSIRVGEHYARARHLADRQIVRIKTTTADVITRSEFESSIEVPLAAWLGRHLLQDQILFVVLTKGIPLRVDGSGGQIGTVASVDSELTLLYRKMTGASVTTAGRTDNPYYLTDRPLAQARRFSHIDSDIYLVTRLDGFTVDDVLKLIDRSMAPSREGEFVLDQRSGQAAGGDQWLAEAAKRLTDAGLGPRVRLEATRAVVTTTQPVLGYFSWGSNDPANQLRLVGVTFSPGAIGGMYVSTDGRTFREPPPNWKPATAGSTTGGQSLVADLVREGISGVSASVAEPYLDGIVRPQILFPAYISGFTLAESYYLAMPYLSWQTIVIGDPLCAPYLASPAPQTDLHKGIDADLSLPAAFGERRLKNAAGPDLKRDAVRLLLRALSLSAQQRPDAEIEAALQQAAGMEPRLTAAQLLLAERESKRGDFDAAIARYRTVVKTEPGNVTALNNLAYYLADRKNLPEEALPLAERAYRLSGQSPTVSDTLGWVHYKLDHLAAALPLLERAAAALPRDADAQIHAATIHASTSNRDRARAYLDAALAIDPALAARADVKAVLEKIKR